MKIFEPNLEQLTRLQIWKQWSYYCLTNVPCSSCTFSTVCRHSWCMDLAGYWERAWSAHRLRKRNCPAHQLVLPGDAHLCSSLVLVLAIVQKRNELGLWLYVTSDIPEQMKTNEMFVFNQISSLILFTAWLCKCLKGKWRQEDRRQKESRTVSSVRVWTKSDHEPSP